MDGNLAHVDAEPQAIGANAGNELIYEAGWYTVSGVVDSSVLGTYSLAIKAADKHGNVATKELLVTVNEAVQEPAETAAPAAAEYTYIANANSKKFHVPNCSEVKKMKEANKIVITATRDEMIAMGYSPCKRCNP